MIIDAALINLVSLIDFLRQPHLVWACVFSKAAFLGLTAYSTEAGFSVEGASFNEPASFTEDALFSEAL